MDANDLSAIMIAAFAALREAKRDPALLEQRFARPDVAEVVGRWPPTNDPSDAAGLTETLSLFYKTRDELTAAETGAGVASHLDELILQLNLAILTGQSEQADGGHAPESEPDRYDGSDESIDGKWPPD